MTTAELLLRGVLLRPDDDTARLVYADALDEDAGEVPCPACVRLKRVPTFGAAKRAELEKVLADCPTCRGTGTVSDGRHECAELIRVQCELARLPRVGEACRGCGYEPEDGYHHNRPDCPQLRSDELIAAHGRAWAPVTCPACGGSGKMSAFVEPSSFDPARCPHCTGTRFAPLEWERGSPVAVRCRMGDVVVRQCIGCGGSAPFGAMLTCECGRVQGHIPTVTPWARAIADAHPVERWEIVDREPLEMLVQGEAFYGWNGGSGSEPHRVPPPVIDAFVETAWFDSPELARAELALAVGRVVHSDWRARHKLEGVT